jgi:5-methylcytosine-specific restriction endonuclease McrA
VKIETSLAICAGAGAYVEISMRTDVQPSYRITPKPLSEIINLYLDRQLNLSPGFQRDSVWTIKDRRALIDSILRQYPLPAIFLYRRVEQGNVVFDVIDGKQRVETILMFIGEKRPRFEVLGCGDVVVGVKSLDWKSLHRHQMQHLLTAYEIPVIEVDGKFGDIIGLFVRINSTGKALTRQEKVHAKYFNSKFLKEANRLANRFTNFLNRHEVLSSGQISRMKHVELISELMLSLYEGKILNKKQSLDRIMQSDSIDGRSLSRISDEVAIVLRTIERLLPDIRSTRFKKLADFYSLAVLLGRYRSNGFMLNDTKRNRLGGELLTVFGNNVDRVAQLQRKARTISPEDDAYRQYVLTTLEGTDDFQQRSQREKLLDSLLGTLFERKDRQRGFTPTQRRIIWNSSAERLCQDCGRKLAWEDFTADHVVAHSRGGRSEIENAAILCRSCNSRKGNRPSHRLKGSYQKVK